MALAQQNHVPQPDTSKLESSAQNLAGAGFRLSLLLNAAACQIAQAGIEIHSIAKGISLFSLALKELGLAFHDGSRSSSSNPSRSAVDKISEIASQGEGILNDIGGMLEKLKATESLAGVSLQQRVKWCFKRHHVTYLLAQLETLKLSLVVMLQVLRLGRLVNHAKKSSKLGTDEVIAQEKAEAQNMIIVWHYASKRLNRLWELVEQEIFGAEHDQTNQVINEHHESASTSTKQTKLPVPSLGNSDGDSDPDLGSSMGRTPKDMVQLSEQILNRLLATMIRDPIPGDSSSSVGTPNTQRTRKVHFSSDSDNSDDILDFDSDSHGIRGYYLEGPTTDWRKPHSQEARQHAARLRKKYAAYQARVESDSDESESEPRSRQESPNTDDDALGFSDEEDLKRKASQPPRERAVMEYNTSSTRNSPQSFDGRQSSLYPPGYYNGQSWYPRPPQQQQQQQQQPYQLYQPYQHQGHGTSHSMPVGIPSRYPHRGTSGHLDTHKQTTSPRFNNPQLQPEHFSPAPLYTSNTNRSYQRLSSRQKPPRENTKGRNKSLADGAKKGLVGVGAIAGFMDALEAFSGL